MSPRTALDLPANALDQEEQSFVSAIRENGWFQIAVPGDSDGPGFSFTTGVWLNARQPELVVFSMEYAAVNQVFSGLFRAAKEGAQLPTGVRTDAVFGNSAAYLFPVAKRHFRKLLGWSYWFYRGDEFPCLQIVWPDRAGAFPWQPEFNPRFREHQPDLTENGWSNEVRD